jgi:uncharacterized protein (TIGR02217 family)
MLEFLESPRFNTEIRYGTSGGAEFSTDITTVQSGVEYRNANWLDSRGRWDIAGDAYDRKQMDSLIAFFRSRKGKAGGFRFKDWSDWRVSRGGAYNEGQFETTASSTHFQMVKRYTVGSVDTYRQIKKPVQGTIKFYVDGVLLTGGDIPAVDYTTGIITRGDVVGLDWTGEFDVPARFDTDKFEAVFEAYRNGDGESMYTVSGLTIVELRE